MATPLRTAVVLTLIEALAAAAIAQEEAIPRAEPSTSLKGGEVYEWTTAAGAPFRYRIPKQMSKASPPNLVLMLHGTGLEWGWAFWNYPIAVGGFRPDDVVVAPEGMTPGQGDTFNFVQGKKDGDHIAALIESLRQALPIGRVYVYGHSQGAFFAYWFAGERPDLVDGIVAHAGNALDVKHTKESRERVAIGILHGKADAVVPVDCAYRTERIYKDEGYRHVRLEVVEGLTEQSGHWPLPVQAAAMLAWLDEVTELSPQKALERALAALEATPPDFGSIRANVARAAALGKAAMKDPQFAAGVARGQAFLAACRAALAVDFAAHQELGAKKPAYGPWFVRFRRAHAVFGDDPEWGKALGALGRAAKAHDKQCEKALRDLGDGSAKALAAVGDALTDAPLAADYDRLRGAFENALKNAPKGLDAKEREKIEKVIAARAADDAQGTKDAVSREADVAREARGASGEGAPK